MPSMANGYPKPRYTAPLRPLPNFTSKAKRARMDRTSPQDILLHHRTLANPRSRCTRASRRSLERPLLSDEEEQERRILSADKLSNISYWIGILKVLNICPRDALMTGGPGSQTQTGSRRSNPCTRARGLRWKSLENSSRPGSREHDRFAETFYQIAKSPLISRPSRHLARAASDIAGMTSLHSSPRYFLGGSPRSCAKYDPFRRAPGLGVEWIRQS